MSWRLIKWELAVIILAVLVLPLALWFYSDHTLGKRLEAELDDLRAQGMPLTMLDARAKAVPDDQNAAVLYQQVFRVDFSAPVSSSSVSLLPDFSGECYDLLDDCSDGLTPEAVDYLRTFFSDRQTQRSLEILREASQRPHSVFPIRWEEEFPVRFSHYALFRRAARVLVVRAALAAHDGDIAEAMEWLEVVFRMSEHIGSESSIISELLTDSMQDIAFRWCVKPSLRDGTVSPQAAKRFEEYLRGIDRYSSFTNAIIWERASGIHHFDLAYREGRSLQKIISGAGYYVGARYATADWVGWLGRVAGPVQKTDQLIYLEYMEEAIRLSRLSLREAKPKLELLTAELESLPAHRAPLAKIMAFANPWAWQKRDRTVANIGMCRIVLGLKVYKREHGKYPTGLRELQQTLDWEVPKDPFSGQDFVYRPQDEGFKLYSFGPNLADDGGVPKYDEQSKQRRQDYDIVWECVK